MKYLDENIIVELSNLVVPTTGTYTYTVKMGDTEVFYGNMYLSAGTTSKSVDITEIVANQKWNPTSCVMNHPAISSVNITSTFTVSVLVGTSTFTGSEDVALIYRYPNRQTKLETSISPAGLSRKNTLFLQGYNGSTGNSVLTPTIPFIVSENYTLPFVNQRGTTTVGSSYYIKTTGQVAGKTLSRSIPTGESFISATLRDLFQNITPKEHPETEIWGSLTSQESEDGQWQYTSDYRTITADDVPDDEITISWNCPDHSENIPITLPENVSYSFEHTFKTSAFDDCYLSFVLSDGQYLEFYVDTAEFNEDREIRVSFSIKLTPNAPNTIDITNVNAYLIGTETLTTATVDLFSSAPSRQYTIANVDVCPSDYYLMWQDRYGSIQSQPFKANHTYSESITRGEVNNTLLQRRVCNTAVQPKWKINSGWIDYDYVPFYESIFVSPFLILYDAKEDHSYPVIISNSEYTEKTRKNSPRQLYNLELDLELSKKQNIIY